MLPDADGRDEARQKTLVLGFGNVNRQDDGAAWHILSQLARRLKSAPPAAVDSSSHVDLVDYDLEVCTEKLDLLFVLQLTPELCELISRYGRVCFVDTHTGRIPEEIHIETLEPELQRSPFTHHLVPNTCLAMTQSLFHVQPEGLLVSVRGYEFDFLTGLSARTAGLIDKAASIVWDWAGSESKVENDQIKH